MKTIDWHELGTDAFPAPAGCAATIGVFDGMHLGHAELIDRVRKSSEPGGRVVVTFRDNPKRILRPHSYGGCLFTLPQKLAALEADGVDTCVLIDFSDDFSKMSGKDFLSVLARGLRPARVVIGHDFRCGHRLSTDASGISDHLSTLGIAVEIVDAVHSEGNIVSSSGIRQAIVAGRLGEAARMLGRPYAVDLEAAELAADHDGFRIVRTCQVLPASGRYRVAVTRDGGATEGYADFVPDGAFVAAGPREGAISLTFIDQVAKREGE